VVGGVGGSAGDLRGARARGVECVCMPLHALLVRVACTAAKRQGRPQSQGAARAEASAHLAESDMGPTGDMDSSEGELWTSDCTS